MKFCQHCGKPIRSDTRFCPYCGAKTFQPKSFDRIRHPYRPAIISRPRRSKKKPILVIGILIIVLALCGVGYKHYQAHSTSSTNLSTALPSHEMTLSTQGKKIADISFTHHEMKTHHVYLPNIQKESLDASIDIHRHNMIFTAPNGDKGTLILKRRMGNKYYIKLTKVTFPDGKASSIHGNKITALSGDAKGRTVSIVNNNTIEYKGQKYSMNKPAPLTAYEHDMVLTPK